MRIRSKKLPIWWPGREEWEVLNYGGGLGAQKSPRLKDYASPKEIVIILESLRPVRNRLNKQGDRKERQAIYWTIEALKRGEIPDGDTISPVLHALPPPFLDLMRKYEMAAALAEKIFLYATSDKAWEQELQRRQDLEKCL